MTQRQKWFFKMIFTFNDTEMYTQRFDKKKQIFKPI